MNKIKESKFKLIFWLTTSCLLLNLYAIEILSIKDIVDNLQNKFNKINTYRARFKIVNTYDSRKEKSEGEIRYRKPDIFLMKFKTPEGQFIFSDGKELKIYIPELRVLGKQKLSGESDISLLITGKTSFYQLKRLYNFSFAKSNKPEKIGDVEVYLLNLEPKEINAGFKNIKLWVAPYWLILKAEGTTLQGNTISISFSDIEINGKIEDAEFEYDLPVNVQTIYNPLYNVEQKK